MRRLGKVKKRSFQDAAANMAAVGSRVIQIARARTEFPGSRNESTLHKKTMRRGNRRRVQGASVVVTRHRDRRRSVFAT